MHTTRGDGVPGTKQRRRDLSSDGVRNLATASRRGRLKEDLESSTWRRHEIEEIIGILIEVEPLDETPLEDLGLNTCNHDILLSSREIPNFDETEPQPKPFPSFPSLEVDLGEKRDLEPPIKPPSPDSFRMKEVEHLTIHTSSSPDVASFHPKNTHYYYHPCIDDPKKHYGFKLGLLGHSGSLGVDFSNMEMIE
ncbi:hypothetical protein Tco_0418539, partial [Tanacetum coccineum]